MSLITKEEYNRIHNSFKKISELIDKLISYHPLNDGLEREMISDQRKEQLISAKEIFKEEEKRIQNELNYEEQRSINKQFELFFTNRKKNIIESCERIIKTWFNSLMLNHIADSIINLVTTIGTNDTFELYQQFKYGDSNYILFGKNGSGKTTLLKKLAATIFNTNTFVIPANRNVSYKGNTFFDPNNVNLSKAISNSSGDSLFLLSQLVIKNELHERRNNKNEELISTKRAIDIFNSLGLERQLNILDNGELKLVCENGTSYSLSSGSDGERSAVFLILTLVSVPENAFVFIDEPENHLNGSLMQNVFDKLESERKDVKFVYATHNIHFIESRSNAELVYLDKSKNTNQLSFKRMEDYGDIPADLILNIEGTNDNVIFCEGEDSDSQDYTLYSTLFPDYKIIPSGGCEKVILQTNLFNKNSAILRKKAYGVIDYDFHDEKYINKLKNENVSCLKVNEIENCLILKPVLEAVTKEFVVEYNIEMIEKKIIEIIKAKTNNIKKDFATKLLRRIHSRNKFTTLDDINAALDNINEENKKNFLNVFNAFECDLASAIESNDYSTLMKMVPGKMIINDVANLFGFQNKKVYINQVILLLNKDHELLDKIKNIIIDIES